MHQTRWVSAILLSISPSMVLAGEAPLYQPAPAWVVPAALPDLSIQSAGESPIILFDLQQRIEGGGVAVYVDTVSRIASPEMLGQMANIIKSWAPDKGDIIIHEVSILRGSETIDLLAKGQRFTVLRREQALEQRELTGILSATLAAEGLQVGDLLRFRATTTSRDQALAGNVQSVVPLPALPFRIGKGQMRISWPVKTPPAWKMLASGVDAKPVRKGDIAELSFALPIVKQPDMPADAPQRYKKPPLIELSTFQSWDDVSKTFAPLYTTDVALAASGPLADEVAKIVAADPSPLVRAQKALQLVQDKIRYLAIGMDGGNYVPQTPARTFELRYGDCKAKTLLLLALLHAMNIDAEPVLAHTVLGDLVRERLPSAMAFNHVLVRATINGETVWLDGTGSASRLADIRDTPPWQTVLPIRGNGAALMQVSPHANARPVIDLSVEADESDSTDLPSVFNATAVIRGGLATQIMLANAQFGEKERQRMVGAFLRDFLGDPQLAMATVAANTEEGTVTLAGRGVTTTPWYVDDRRRKRALTSVLSQVAFAPDRGRPAWATIPVAATNLSGTRVRLKLRLPDKGRGFTLEGEHNLRATIAGYALDRTTTLSDGLVTVDERVEGTGVEVPVAEIPAQRDAFATATARVPIITASLETKRRWDLGGVGAKGEAQVAAVEAVFAQAIANDPDEVTGYQSRASFRAGIGDLKGALADLSQAIKVDPSVDHYLWRAGIASELGDIKASLADAQAARALDPSSMNAIERTAWYLAENGDLAGGTALIDERIGQGGSTKPDYQREKANLLGAWGDVSSAMTLLDGLIADKPGSPSLLNARCWIKGIRNVMLDTALKDCTSAIELSENAVPMLDSRAMIWFRMGRFEDALRDLDTVVASAPNIAQSRFLRGVVLTRMDKKDEAAKELAIARRLNASIVRTNARYGIQP